MLLTHCKLGSEGCMYTQCKLGSEGCMYTDTGSWDLRGVYVHTLEAGI